MHALRVSDRRTLGVLGAGMLAAVAVGLVAGRYPAIAAAGVVAIVLAVVMVTDLAVGIAVFTMASFAEVMSSGSASLAKGVGALLLLAWAVRWVGRSMPRARGLFDEQRTLVLFAVGLLAWSILSAAWAQSPHTALSGASRYAQDLVLLPIVYAGVTEFKHIRLVAAAFVAGAIGATAYGVLTGSTVAGTRLVGALGDPNETASVLVAAAVLAIGLGASSQASPWRRALALAAAAVALLGAAATASRGE